MAEKRFLDLTGLQNYDAKIKTHIASADAEILAQSKAYFDDNADMFDAAGTAATKVQELANGQVKVNTDAISAINNERTGILKQAKDYADSKDEAIASAQAAADQAQSEVDAAEGRIIKNEEDIGIMKGQISALEAGTYDDTEVRNLIQGNTDNITSVSDRMTATEAGLGTLIGDDANKSARTIANEELAKQLVAEGAQDSLDTLTEIALWIQSHPGDAAAMNAAIKALESLVGTLPSGVTATTIVAYIQEVVTAENARAEGIEAGLEGRLSAIEGNIGSGDVDSRIATAKQEAINVASADASSKFDQALADAKSYADDKVSKIDLSGINTNEVAIASLNGRMDTAESDIDKIEVAIGEGGSVTLAIVDAKQAGISAQNSVGVLDASVTQLSTKVGTNESNISVHGGRLSELENKVGDGFIAITNEEINAMF